MAAIINTNVISLNAQRNLNSSQNALATTLQRLSSGLRINSAKDDAAGLAISERMTSQIRGLTRQSAMPMTASRCRKPPKARWEKSATTCSASANWPFNHATPAIAQATAPR